jgi:hypothetical protein
MATCSICEDRRLFILIFGFRNRRHNINIGEEENYCRGSILSRKKGVTDCFDTAARLVTFSLTLIRRGRIIQINSSIILTQPHARPNTKLTNFSQFFYDEKLSHTRVADNTLNSFAGKINLKNSKKNPGGNREEQNTLR